MKKYKNKPKVYFVGAGPGDPKLLTIKAKELIENADFILYTSSLIPPDVLKWTKKNATIKSSSKLNYKEIFKLIEQYSKKGLFIRLHTGDPSIYSSIAKQISFLKEKNINYEIIPGVSAVSAAAARLNIEYTLPSLSQTLIISRIPGNTPNPETLTNILNCTASSIVFYLSIKLIGKLKKEALKIYHKNTPCWVIEKASWQKGEQIIKGTISNIEHKVNKANIQGIALILLGNFLTQKENAPSHLYSKNKITKKTK